MAKEQDQSSARPLTKTQILSNMAESTGLSKKQIGEFFEALSAEIQGSLADPDGPGQFTIPGLCKIVVKQKPATPERMVRNPFTGEMVQAAAKPASSVVRIRPLMGLKRIVTADNDTEIPPNRDAPT